MIDASLLPALYDVLITARRGSVAAAAAELHKTPSAVSQQIRRLEEVFKVAVFEKAGRGIRLTAVGEALVAPATRLFDEAEAVFGLLAELAGNEPSIVRLAVSDYMGKDLLAPVMREIAASTKSVRFEITTAHSAESLRLLERSAVDFAIVTSPQERADLVEHELFRQRMVWVCAATDDPTALADRLATEPLLRLEQSSVGRGLLDAYLRERAITPASTIDVPSVSLLLAYAGEGVGIGLAPQLPLREFTESLDMHDSGLPPMPVKLVFRKNYRLRPAVEAFVERLLQEGQRIAKTLKSDRLA
jgi:DNA-binding transcriptional LysR family regulator